MADNLPKSLCIIDCRTNMKVLIIRRSGIFDVPQIAVHGSSCQGFLSEFDLKVSSISFMLKITSIWKFLVLQIPEILSDRHSYNEVDVFCRSSFKRNQIVTQTPNRAEVHE